MKLSPVVILGIGILAIVLISTVAIAGEIGYPGGWECQDTMKSTTVNGMTFTPDNLPNNGTVGTSYSKFDADDPKTGLPDINIQLWSPIEYVCIDGQWTPAREGEHFKDLQKTIGNDTYFFEQHVFWFKVRIIAEADYYTSYDPLLTWHGEAKGMVGVIRPDINVRILLNTPLWRVVSSFTDGNATYVKSAVWTGIMSTTVVGAGGKYVEALDDDWDGIPGYWSLTNTGPLNMFLVSGAGVSSSTLEGLRDTPGALANVPSQIYADISGTSLLAGWWAPPGGSTTINAVEVDYTVRFDVVTSAKYTFQQGSQPTTTVNASIEDKGGKGWFEKIGDWFEGVLGILGSPFTFVIIIIVIIGVFFVVIKVFGHRR